MTLSDQMQTLYNALTTAQTELAATVPYTLDGDRQRHGPQRKDRVLGPAVVRQQARLAVAQAALAVAQTVLDEPASMAAAVVRLDEAVTRLRQSMWVDVRMVRRPALARIPLPDGTIQLEIVRRAFGPYVYLRWTESGRQRSYYLGRVADTARWEERLADIGLTIADVADLVAAASSQPPPSEERTDPD